MAACPSYLKRGEDAFAPPIEHDDESSLPPADAQAWAADIVLLVRPASSMALFERIRRFGDCTHGYAASRPAGKRDAAGVYKSYMRDIRVDDYMQ